MNKILFSLKGMFRFNPVFVDNILFTLMSISCDWQPESGYCLFLGLHHWQE